MCWNLNCIFDKHFYQLGDICFYIFTQADFFNYQNVQNLNLNI